MVFTSSAVKVMSSVLPRSMGAAAFMGVAESRAEADMGAALRPKKSSPSSSPPA